MGARQPRSRPSLKRLTAQQPASARSPARSGPLGNLAFHMLLALGEGPAHGYAIGKDVETRSGGALDPTTGALYQALKRLADDGLVEPLVEAPEPVSDARRRYFRLTVSGRAAAAREAARLAGLVAAARERNLYPASA